MASPQDYTPSDLLQNPNVRRYLDMIALAEGTNTHGYNTMFGGGRLPSLSDHPRQTMPFTQTDGVKNRTSAAGRYQFLESTWDDQAKKLNLPNFSPRSQDLAAINILKETGALPHILNGEWEPALNKTGTIWAGLPTSPYKQPHQSREFVMSALNNESPSAVPERSIEDIQRAYEKAKAAGATASVERIGNLLNARYESAIQKATEAGRPDAVERIKATRDRIIGAGAVTPQAAQEPAMGAEAALGTPQQDGQPPEPSERDMGGIPPTSQPAPMYAGTTSSFTTPVETQGGAVLTTRRKGIAGGKQVMPEDSLGMTLANAVDPFVRGVADAATFGYADELAALAGEKTGLNPTAGAPFGSNKAPVPLVPEKSQSYQSLLNRERVIDTQGGLPRLVGQVGASLLPTTIAVQAPAILGRTGRALVGAGTGGTQGFLYGTGSSEGLNWDERMQDALPEAGVGAVTGGVLGGLLPATVAQTGSKIIKKAGSERAARLDAEIIQDLNKIAKNEANRGNPVQAIQANALEQRYIADVNKEIKKFGKDGLNRLGVTADDITSAIQNRRIITPDELAALRGNPAGDALADSIEKAQRTRSLTAPDPASTNIFSRTGRTLLDLAPLPQPVRYMGQRMLGARSTREDVINKLISDKTAAAAENVTGRLGPSGATESLAQLREAASKSITDRALQARLAQEAKAAAQQAQAAQTLTEKNAILGATKMPLGGSFQELLQGGRSGLNLTTDQAIDALRIVASKNKDNPLGIAANQIRKSNEAGVTSPQAFYGLQNEIRKLQEGGILSGQSGALTSQATPRTPIFNPVSYAANVRTAEAALKTATEAAPSNALAQFANVVAGTKDPVQKANLVQQKLATTTDPVEAAFINNFVQPLTQFGSKAKKATDVAEGALSTVTKSEKPVVAPKTKAQKPKAEPKGEKVDIKEPPALTKATKETSQTLPEDVQERLKRENEASLKAIFPGGVPDWFKPGPF